MAKEKYFGYKQQGLIPSVLPKAAIYVTYIMKIATQGKSLMFQLIFKCLIILLLYQYLIFCKQYNVKNLFPTDVNVPIS